MPIQALKKIRRKIFAKGDGRKDTPWSQLDLVDAVGSGRPGAI